MYLTNGRVVLVGWMINVGDNFHLNKLTINASIEYLDRTSAPRRADAQSFQPCAAACILLACECGIVKCERIRG